MSRASLDPVATPVEPPLETGGATEPAAPPLAPAPPPTPAVSPVHAERRLIALLLGGTFVVGVLLQQFIAPGPAALVLSSLAVMSLLSVAALVVKGRLLDTLSGFRLAAAVLATLALGSALGTLVLQGRPASFYAEEYGPMAWLVRGLRLDDLFHTLWFGGFVGLMCAGLITSAVRRWPMTWRNAGFFAVHLGILVSLAGAALSSVYSVKGRIDLRVGGGAASVIQVTRGGKPTGEQLPLGASVLLEQFDVDHYREQLRIGIYLPSRKSGQYELEASYDNDLGVKHRLPAGNSFLVKAFYPDLVLEERVVEADQGSPALRVSIAGGEPQWLLAGAHERLDAPDSRAIVLFGQTPPNPDLSSPRHLLRLGDGPPVPVRPGESVELSGLVVTVRRFFPHFTYDIAAKAAVNASDEPRNPALEVEVAGLGTRWLFAMLGGHSHREGDPALAYSFMPAETGRTVVAVGAADRSVQVRRPDGSTETLALAEGLEVEGVRFDRLLPAARVEREAKSASDEPKNPAVLVQITEGETTWERLLTTAPRDGVQVGEAILTFQRRGNEVKSFRSQVGIFTGQQHRSEIIAVNEPLVVGPWKLYQVNYNPEDPTYSGLEAVRDPGVDWVFAGFGLMFFGVFYLVYVQPRLKRKRPAGAGR